MQGGDILNLVNPECSTRTGFYSQLLLLIFGVKWEIPGLAQNPIILYYYYNHRFVWLLTGLIQRQMEYQEL